MRNSDCTLRGIDGLIKRIAGITDQYKRDIRSLENEKIMRIGRARILCRGCNRKRPLLSFVLVIRQFYNTNTGSPNGGYWYYGELQYGHLRCGACGEENRNYIYNHPECAKILRLLELSRGEYSAVFNKPVEYSKEQGE